LTTTTESSGRSRIRIFLWFLFRACVGIGLIYLIFRLVSIREIVQAFQSASLSFIAIGALFLVLNILIQTMKWRYMLRIVKDESSWWESSTSVLLGIALGSFTPGNLGELGGRSLRVEHSKTSHIVGLTMVDRTQAFLVLTMGGMFSYSFFVFARPLTSSLVGLACVLLFVYLYFRIDLVKTVADKINIKVFRHRWIDGIIESFTFIGRDHFLSTLLYSVCFYGILYAQMFFFLNAFSSVTPWTAFLGFSAFMFAKSTISISIGDIGVREATSAYFFTHLGVPTVTALNAAGLMFVFNVILPSLVGVLFLPSLKLFPNHTRQSDFTSTTSRQ
jgi:uncharacterized protein (TIRG00374 family)